jgi:hypothetical protein
MDRQKFGSREFVLAGQARCTVYSDQEQESKRGSYSPYCQLSYHARCLRRDVSGNSKEVACSRENLYL